MKTNKNKTEKPEDNSKQSNFSRRKFIKNSAGVLAAGTVLGLGGVAACAQDNSIKAAPLDSAGRLNTKPGDLYNEKVGYSDRDVTGWKGRYIYGPTVGIIQLPANIPMLPGDMGNPTTFDYPVLYELLEDVDPFWVLAAEPHPIVMEKCIEACKKLANQGVKTIIGNCGFFANYQPEVSKSLDPGVQFFNGSLMQVPMLLTSVGANKKVGILTASAELLIPSPALKNSGVSEKDMDRIVIVGNENGEQMKLITGETGSFNPKKMEKELVALATKMMQDHPDIGAVVLECTEFPPYAHAIQDAIRRNVWDFVTLTNFMHAGAMRTPYKGWM